jgi:class 3 adenylate cyclase
VTIHDASAKIDKAKLGLSNSKRVEAVSLFADVDGFTAYIEDADASGTLPEAVRAYHVIRSEMRNTAVTDFDALRIQYQGDRMQALAYLPINDTDAAALTAVRTAAALNSVTTHVLSEVIGAAAKPIAIGLAAGTVLVSKLGQYGDRDVVSLGWSTAEAARIQEALEGGQIGIDAELRRRLPEWLQRIFVWEQSPRAYVAKDLTLDELDRLEASESSMLAKGLVAGAVAGAAIGAGVALVRSRKEQEKPLRPWMG